MLFALDYQEIVDEISDMPIDEIKEYIYFIYGLSSCVHKKQQNFD